MKQKDQLSFAAPLYVVLALLFCFGSCQSSDNAKISEGASVASLPLTAQLGEASSRVGMSDTYGGAFSCYWNGDKFDIYQKYVQDGTVQNMTGLEFGTTATNGTSATFSCATGGTYRYNPGAQLYAFSKGTSGGYTGSVTEDGTSTLTANTLAGQNGTLADCAKYDALYGSAKVDYSTGLPGSLAMHHLFGMMNLHLTSSTFSTGYPVAVTLTSSAANVLPDNGGSATLAPDGATLTQAGTWGTNWSATVTPTADGVLDVYFMTWPFSATSGTLTVSCSDGTGYVYTPRTITLSAFSLAAAQIKSKPLAIANTPFTYDSSKLFAWDATNSQPVTLNSPPTNTNVITVPSSETDYTSRAQYACKNCPNYCDISWYLNVDCYWDAGGITGGNTTNYNLADGSTTTAGMWFRKKSGITGFSSTTSSGTIFRAPVVLTADLASSLNLDANYFFLPAVGFTDNTNGSMMFGKSRGHYWSSTPDVDTSKAYCLRFVKTGAYLDSSFRMYGFCLWQAQ